MANLKRHQLVRASSADAPIIWKILQTAIAKRKAEGSMQWQDGYPNPKIIERDIQSGAAYKLLLDHQIIGYCAVYINDEPAYQVIDGAWLSKEDFMVFHRVAIAEQHLGQGNATILLQLIEQLAKEKNIRSIKADTNFDNHTMLYLFKKEHYVYCGKVYVRESERLAFEKYLPPLDKGSKQSF